MANAFEPIKNAKNLKSLLMNLLHRGPLNTISVAADWAALRCTLAESSRLTQNRFSRLSGTKIKVIFYQDM